MKKTLTVNLGGTVFNIDEDAYELLEKYLSNLRIHFSKEEGAAEIMNDFEQRISELFNDRVGFTGTCARADEQTSICFQNLSLVCVEACPAPTPPPTFARSGRSRCSPS